jgi:dihydroneopterin aldolase
MDIIFISELRLDALIGIYAWEHEVAQTIEINVELAVDASRCAHSGKISDTIDYAKVVERISAAVTARHYTLLEKLAEEIAGVIMREFDTPWLRLSIAKLAPLRGVKKLGVTIERGNRKVRAAGRKASG